MEERPKLSDKGHVVIVTLYKPYFGGTPTVMENLLSGFDPRSYSIATYSQQFEAYLEETADIQVFRFFKHLKSSFRLNQLYKRYFIRKNSTRLARFCQSRAAKVIVGVYPDIHLLNCAYEAARKINVPLIPYLHDTIVEGLHDKPWWLRQRAQKIQQALFSSCHTILVISEGLARLYREKYGLITAVLEHTYPEEATKPAITSLRNGAKRIFWGGAVGRFNHAVVRRASLAAKALYFTFEITGASSKRQLEQQRINTDNVTLAAYANRADYIEALQAQDILILGINWPDESPLHLDELSTIFPTKAVEYLFSGVPIVVHCPENYFLARFFTENNCGYVVSDRSAEALSAGIVQLLTNDDLRQKLIAGAFEVSTTFEANRLQKKFAAALHS
jgi:glycosyltransferase involved in cell wall biosynthesis